MEEQASFNFNDTTEFNLEIREQSGDQGFYLQSTGALDINKLNFEISSLKQKVKEVKGRVEHHLIKDSVFQYDQFLAPIVHFVKNDI